MKSVKASLKVIAMIFAAMFIINLAVMFVFFNINALNPVYSGGNEPPKYEGTTQTSTNENLNKTENDVKIEDTIQSGSQMSQETSNDNEIKTPDKNENTANLSDTSGYFMTTEDVKKLENLSFSDKLEALSYISKIGSEDADIIYDMAKDGISYDEIDKIKVILLKYLSNTEIETINSIINKIFSGQKTIK